MDEMLQPTTFLSLSFQKVVTYCTLKSFADIFYNSYLNLASFWKGTKKLTELRQKKKTTTQQNKQGFNEWPVSIDVRHFTQ